MADSQTITEGLEEVLRLRLQALVNEADLEILLAYWRLLGWKNFAEGND